MPNFLQQLFGQSADPYRDQFRDQLLSRVAGALSSGGDFSQNIAGAVGDLGQIRAQLAEAKRRRDFEAQEASRRERLDQMNAEAHRAELRSRALADESTLAGTERTRQGITLSREESERQRRDESLLTGVRDGTLSSLAGVLGPDDRLLDEARQVMASTSTLPEARSVAASYLARARERAAMKKRGVDVDDPLAVLSAEADIREKINARYRPAPQSSQQGVLEYGGQVVTYNPITGESRVIVQRDVAGENARMAKEAAVRAAASSMIDPGQIYDYTSSIIEQLERADAAARAAAPLTPSPMFGDVIGGGSSATAAPSGPPPTRPSPTSAPPVRQPLPSPPSSPPSAPITGPVVGPPVFPPPGSPDWWTVRGYRTEQEARASLQRDTQRSAAAAAAADAADEAAARARVQAAMGGRGLISEGRLSEMGAIDARVKGVYRLLDEDTVEFLEARGTYGGWRGSRAAVKKLLDGGRSPQDVARMILRSQLGEGNEFTSLVGE